MFVAGCGAVKELPDSTTPPDVVLRCKDGTRAPGEVCFATLVIDHVAAVVDAQLADVDDDGDLDLGFALGDNLAFRFQAAGVFGPAVMTFKQPSSFLVVRDITGDRKADMISAGPGTGPTSLTTFRGDGKGGQEPVYVDRTAGTPRGLAMANLDGAGPDELVEFDDNKLLLWTVGTNAVISELGTAIDVAGLAAGAAGKIDEDAFADVVVAVPGGVFLRRGVALGLGPAEPVTTQPATAVAIGDVDGDGRPDIVYALNGMVGVMRGNGARGFTAVPPRAVPGAGRLLELADIDGDGRADVISANGAALEIALGQADGTLGDLHEIPLDDKPSSIHANMDMNGDRAPDIVITSGTTITLLISQP